MHNDKKKSLVPKSTLVIRLIVGGYLVYLAYELIMGLREITEESAPVAVSVGAAVVFAICGLILMFFSGRDFLKGNFQGGIMDVPKEEDSGENV